MPKIGVSLIVLMIFLAGCNKNEQNGDETMTQSLVGYVGFKDNNRAILITDTEEKPFIKNKRRGLKK